MSMNHAYALERMTKQIKTLWPQLSLIERVKIMNLLERLELQYEQMAELSYRSCEHLED